MFKRLIQWLKKFFQHLFGGRQMPAQTEQNPQQQAPPPLDDTDLEFLFNELLEGVYQARGQAWAHKWLHNIEHRVSTERWVEWLQRFGQRLQSSPSPNTELASRLVMLGELDVGEVGDTAYDIGMQLLTRANGEPIWEYEGPDAESSIPSAVAVTSNEAPLEIQGDDFSENAPDGEFQTVTLDQLLVMMEQDENLRQLIAHQLGLETDNPEDIIQALLAQFYDAHSSTAEQPEA